MKKVEEENKSVNEIKIFIANEEKRLKDYEKELDDDRHNLLKQRKQ